ncbi:hypothetical protein SAMN02745225_02378 [Ferrithrix thermotolerans DSM 19514]|uniref:Uncharacterized protein n=1 Tax=Ferrithrix thermotolerans DSM 19514 TaxID=1121881 RepID=A0A1M4YNN4_9ACTN|nr:hypothetical protein [Ferrithrix thermotolerans]SHF07247.1 hypothetical protein SAMN02745225_02378 [Ferrithrix thermotolerans DSM 19514]
MGDLGTKGNASLMVYNNLGRAKHRILATCDLDIYDVASKCAGN